MMEMALVQLGRHQLLMQSGKVAMQFLNSTGDPGVKASVTNWTDVCSIFQLFITEAFVNSIVDETNSYATEMGPKTKTVCLVTC